LHVEGEMAEEESLRAQISESHAAAAEKFFAAFGLAIFASCQLQYRLAQLYGVSFDTVRDGCLPRVDEKIFEALKKSLGNAVAAARESAAIKGSLLVEVESAHHLRDYIVHRLFIGTRSLQNESGFPVLVERLEKARTFFELVSQHLDEQHTKILKDTGISDEIRATYRKAWDELDDELIEIDIPLPRRTERIVHAYQAPGPVGERLLLENDQGTIWQLTDKGLAHCGDARAPSWVAQPDVQKYLPTGVNARPTRDSRNSYRGPFEYDLWFDNGACLRISRGGASKLLYEILPPRGGKGKRNKGRRP
jgi:hypothetical protein